jgi:hypothetical protein
MGQTCLSKWDKDLLQILAAPFIHFINRGTIRTEIVTVIRLTLLPLLSFRINFGIESHFDCLCLAVHTDQRTDILSGL